MGSFHLTSIRAVPCPTDRKRCRHITEVELHGADGFHRVDIAVVRLMLSAGDNIVAMSAKAGVQADVRKGKCVCGVKTLRSANGTRRDDDLTLVPDLS
jgi:hypothetical protein